MRQWWNRSFCGERERERERDRQTDRQTDRHTQLPNKCDENDLTPVITCTTVVHSGICPDRYIKKVIPFFCCNKLNNYSGVRLDLPAL